MSSLPEIRRFRLESRLGKGGMGTVYRALDRGSGRPLALKMLHAMSAEALLLFKNEFRALQELHHPNLVELGELVEEHGRWYFTMELVDGAPISRHVRPNQGFDAGETVRGQVSPDVISDAATLPFGDGSGEVAAAEPAGEPPGFDEGRLRSALAGLAGGLSALHSHGIVHRDVKPSNVLVEADGRVVLLDFGVAASRLDREAADVMLGTPGYMAPEQAGGADVGPAADWYAVGAILYQALTGRLPFLGTLMEVIEQKLARDPVPPSELVPELPEDLERLCLGLLARDPDERAGARDVLMAAGRGPRALAAVAGSPPPVHRPDAGAEGFVGRAGELAMLDQALSDARNAGAVCALVRGESGVGKSALVDAWLARLGDRPEETTVLWARCYERESVPYKAVDGVVDALGGVLARLPAEEAGELLPNRPAVLAQVFPALGRVSALAEAARAEAGEAAVADPMVRRRELFAGLRTLLARLAWRAPLVLAIDDLQWADPDSMALLAEIVRPPGGARCLLLVTQRSGYRGDPEAPSVGLLGVPVHEIELGPMIEEDARALAAAVLGGGIESGTGRAQAIAREAQCHPMFIAELARRAPGDAGGATLEQALWSRIDRLEAEHRSLLVAVACAGAPVPQQIAGEAAALAAIDLAPAVTRLRAERLVRTGGAAPGDPVEPYHGRIREAVLARLGREDRRDTHRRLAEAIEAAGGADPEALFGHYREAGDRGRAARYAADAGAKAAAALAFNRAAALYRAAIELDPEATDRDAWRRALGDALAGAGRGPEAAEELLTAARDAGGADRLDLERRAAEQLLRAGHTGDGLAVLTDVVAGFGYRLPKSSRGALPRLLLLRGRLRTRGLAFAERDPAAIDPDLRARMDVCWSAAVGLAMIDAVRGAVYQTRLLLQALGAGDAYRAALGLSLEAAYQAADGSKGARRTQRVVELARTLAEKTGDPHAIGMSFGSAAMAAYLCGRFADALELSEKANAVFRERCTGCAWERDTADIVTTWSRIYMGDFEALARSIPRLLRDAEARGDRYAATGLRTGTAVALPLSRDDPERARAAVAETMAGWSRDQFLHQHWDELLAECEIDLYQGDGRAALERLEARWRQLSRSMVLMIQVSRIEARFARGRACLIASPGDPRLLRRAARDAARLVGEGCAWAIGLGLLLRAGVENLRGQPDAASATLEDAAASLAAADMLVHAAVARRARGTLLRDDALFESGDALLRDRGIVAPDKYAAMLAPGLQQVAQGGE